MNEEKKVQLITMMEYSGWNNGIYVRRQSVGHSFERHWHDHYEIEYIVEGTGTHIFNGVEYPICPGALHLLTPADFHELIPNGTYKAIKINYRANDVDPFILNTLVGLSHNAPLYISESERQLFDTVFSLVAQVAEQYDGSPYRALSLQKLLETILLSIINYLKCSNDKPCAGAKEATAESNEVFQRILMYVHQNFKKSLDLKSVGEVVHYSPSYLSKIFHRTTGIPFKAYVTNLRMNFAANLIANSDMKITDIGREAGFSTLSNFTKEFKKFYHISPSDYRNANKVRVTEVK